MGIVSRLTGKEGTSLQKLPAAVQQASQSDRQRTKDQSTSKVLKYLDDYRSANDAKALRDEGYEIDYDRLVGVGKNSAVFLAHSTSATPPPADKDGQRPLYTPGYDIAAKVVAKKWINKKRPSKTRTGNLKLALALGQTKPENNILKVIDVFKTAERIFIFMQYCAYGNVISFIRRNGQVSSKLTQRWSNQMATALCFLHKFHVAHRNYKLENVLIDENLNAKLTGFGLSKFCIDLQTKQPVLSRTICGSEPYLAPEMLKEAKDRYYDPKQADVWAFGVGVFLCSTRRYPFEADNLRALKAEQSARRYMERDSKHRLTVPVRDLLNQIFTIDPNQRPTMQELLNQSAWLSQAPEPLVSSRQSPGAAPRSPGPTDLARSDISAVSGPAQRPAQRPVQHNPQRATHDHQHQRQHQSPRTGPVTRVVHATNKALLDNKTESGAGQDQLSPVVPVAHPATDALPHPGAQEPSYRD